MVAAGASATLTLGASPVRTPAGHSQPFEQTERRLEPLLDRVPITRVYDATMLDYLGFPVWGAVTPLARDLTVHAGKGETGPAARCSAIMEAIERVCAEDLDPARATRATYTELRRHGALDPELFDLPFETTYRPDRPLLWVQGVDLFTGRKPWVALDLVISPPNEGVCVGVETNGLAAGNDYTEAVLHALYEVVERDAAAHETFAALYADGPDAPPLKVIDPTTIPAAARTNVRALQERGIETTVQEITHDLAVPVFRVAISDRAFPGREGVVSRFEGFGAALDPERALSRAIHEAAQSHTAVLLGARDAFEGAWDGPPLSAEWLVRQLTRRSAVVPFADHGQRPPPSDLHDELTAVLERLAGAGLRHCVVVDLTRGDLGIPVVRVLVPGLSGPYGDTARRPTRRLLRTLL